ncbi:MAG: hypothetical protein U1E15_04765 [Hyphomicrobiales bacterium]
MMILQLLRFNMQKYLVILALAAFTLPAHAGNHDGCWKQSGNWTNAPTWSCPGDDHGGPASNQGSPADVRPAQPSPPPVVIVTTSSAA